MIQRLKPDPRRIASGASFTTALLLFVLFAAVPALAQDPSGYTETIIVERHVVNVRALDGSGRAITDLTAGDFVVTIGRRSAVVESASWVAADEEWLVPPPIEVDGEEIAGLPETGIPAGARLLVVLVQTDFARAPARVVEHVKFNTVYADAIIGMLQPDDHVAVFSFDSHLKLRADFTRDHDAILKAVKESILTNRVPMPEPRETGPSIARYLDHDLMRRVANVEAGLLMIANALRVIDGRRVVVLAGWGLGQRQAGGGGVSLPREWNEAVALLRNEEIPVISISHGVPGGELWQGLQQTADSTGGIHVSVSEGSPVQMLAEIRGALAGHYELEVRLDEALEPGRHALRVRTTNRRVRVIAPPSIHVSEPLEY